MRKIKTILTLSLATAIIFSGFSKTTVNADSLKSNRIAGDNRVQTAIEISKKSYKSSDSLILASTTGDVDALTGTILASTKKAPMLLTYPDKLTKELSNEIIRINPQKIYLLGGTTVISEKVENELKKKYHVSRIAGKNRDQTAIKIMEEANIQKDEYFLTSGYEGLVDALAIGPVSAKTNTPIFLTGKNKLAPETLAKIKQVKPKKITIIGGYTVVSKEVEKQLPKEIVIERVSGSNRINTSLAIADKYFKDNKEAILANGFAYADAVVGGYYANIQDAPIIVTYADKTTKETKDYIQNNNLNLTVLGGNNAINESVVKTLLEKEEVVEPEPSPDPKPSPDPDPTPEPDPIPDPEPEPEPEPEEEIPTEEEKIAIRVDEKIDKIIRDVVKPEMNEYAKVKAVHDYIIDNTTYSLYHSRLHHVILENKGNCYTYTIAFNKILNRMGIETLYVEGTLKTSGGSHAWSKVKINNKWYNTDITNAPPTNYGNQPSTYRRFMVTDLRLSKTNTVDKAYRNQPVADDPQYEDIYFRE